MCLRLFRRNQTVNRQNCVPINRNLVPNRVVYVPNVPVFHFLLWNTNNGKYQANSGR